ncbi:MAG: TatD family hydrolase [Elusimicrobiaceae bacterium]|nr:TatD family hydrolase [Elusimicrobiaceae bacterium]
MYFIDSHAHINDEAFDKDRKDVIEKSLLAGVKNIVEIACEEPEWQEAVDLCAKYPDVFCAVCGIHPIYASARTEEQIKKLKEFLKNPIFRAVGEIGLDYAWLNSSTEKQQQDVFEEMLGLAKEINKPVVLHCRKTNEPDDFKAYEDLFSIMKNHDAQGGIFHCFSARYIDAKRALDRGFLLGLNGVISYKKNNDLRDVIKKIGIEYFVLETDCPYLPPQTKRGQRNSPQNIPEIAEYLANLLNIPLETCAKITTQNAKNFFKI